MIKVNAENCTGCRRCEIVCSMVRYHRIDPYRRRIRIFSEWPWKEEITVCRMCENPKCVQACESQALQKSDSGFIRLDPQACTGCFQCVAACPFNAIWKDEENQLPLLCDACGGEYNCVKWCPEKALVEVK